MADGGMVALDVRRRTAAPGPPWRSGHHVGHTRSLGKLAATFRTSRSHSPRSAAVAAGLCAAGVGWTRKASESFRNAWQALSAIGTDLESSSRATADELRSHFPG